MRDSPVFLSPVRGGIRFSCISQGAFIVVCVSTFFIITEFTLDYCGLIVHHVIFCFFVLCRKGFRYETWVTLGSGGGRAGTARTSNDGTCAHMK